MICGRRLNPLQGALVQEAIQKKSAPSSAPKSAALQDNTVHVLNHHLKMKAPPTSILKLKAPKCAPQVHLGQVLVSRAIQRALLLSALTQRVGQKKRALLDLKLFLCTLTQTGKLKLTVIKKSRNFQGALAPGACLKS